MWIFTLVLTYRSEILLVKLVVQLVKKFPAQSWSFSLCNFSGFLFLCLKRKCLPRHPFSDVFSLSSPSLHARDHVSYPYKRAKIRKITASSILKWYFHSTLRNVPKFPYVLCIFSTAVGPLKLQNLTLYRQFYPSKILIRTSVLKFSKGLHLSDIKLRVRYTNSLFRFCIPFENEIYTVIIRSSGYFYWVYSMYMW